MLAVTFALPSESREFVRLVATHNRKVTVLAYRRGRKELPRPD